MRGKAVLLSCIVTAAMAVTRDAAATSSEWLCYTSPTAKIRLAWNGPFEIACSSIFGFANPRMPLFLGLEREATRRGRHFSVEDWGWTQHTLSIDGVPVSLPGPLKTSELARVIADSLGCNVVPRRVVPLLSIQIELLPPGADAKTRVKAWSGRALWPCDDLGVLSHCGDCNLTPFWSHRYDDGSVGIRYGLFRTYADAWRSADTLRLRSYGPQIVKTFLKAHSLNVYFGGES
jgi:hypothetical protein